ncbi:hypothetical protein [Pleionea sp. CnH1-48]|uniref:hypothetical protein n=1 Tax=Pleionea sp. CnH1-48 TaxID=2954494 RepID=UPI0020984E2D|nr:hypothetical protein [Pleionea sp. CnH1-48]MCO7225265.1 hypothetical protein [Pleionea sp. CnH1-48]
MTKTCVKIATFFIISAYFQLAEATSEGFLQLNHASIVEFYSMTDGGSMVFQIDRRNKKNLWILLDGKVDSQYRGCFFISESPEKEKIRVDIESKMDNSIINFFEVRAKKCELSKGTQKQCEAVMALVEKVKQFRGNDFK